ncbi:hypothetical protein K439DRAFT_211123 [Ramaria rubella]|nr:hypothetical protein K439DRAFT_211123 [Ramaria rubella]
MHRPLKITITTLFASHCYSTPRLPNPTFLSNYNTEHQPHYRVFIVPRVYGLLLNRDGGFCEPPSACHLIKKFGVFLRSCGTNALLDQGCHFYFCGSVYGPRGCEDSLIRHCVQNLSSIRLQRNYTDINKKSYTLSTTR